VWREMVKAPIAKTVKAPDNRAYSLTITAHFVRGTQDISVTLSLTREGLIRRGSIRQNFVITPDNELRLYAGRPGQYCRTAWMFSSLSFSRPFNATSSIRNATA